jgi:hypothetical protein
MLNYALLFMIALSMTNECELDLSPKPDDPLVERAIKFTSQQLEVPAEDLHVVMISRCVHDDHIYLARDFNEEDLQHPWIVTISCTNLTLSRIDE